MATTQIPPPEPAAADPHAEPVLLVQLQDELARSRMREAFWISIIVHVVLVVAIATLPPLFPQRDPLVVATAADLIRDQDVRFLALPPDLAPPPAEKPKTNILSDKDRIASSRSPQLEPDALRDGFRPGPPAPPAQASPRPAPARPAQAAPGAGQQQTQQQEPAPQPGPSDSQTPALTARVERPQPSPSAQPAQTFGGGVSAGTAIEQAARAAVAGRGAGVGGEFGLGAGSPARMGSNLDILSDTMGVDFGPYLSRVLHTVRGNWILLIPEVARAPLMKRGQVSIEFAITKDGSVAGMRLAGPSGDVSLDRAAWGGITASNPFPPLPPQFGGEYLALRFHFYYNPDRNEMR